MAPRNARQQVFRGFNRHESGLAFRGLQLRGVRDRYRGSRVLNRGAEQDKLATGG
jgi:hypothetical protein